MHQLNQPLYFPSGFNTSKVKIKLKKLRATRIIQCHSKFLRQIVDTDFDPQTPSGLWVPNWMYCGYSPLLQVGINAQIFFLALCNYCSGTLEANHSINFILIKLGINNKILWMIGK